MAGFSEVVRIKKRMCNYFSINTCKNCPLLHRGCGIISTLGHSDYEFKELEDTLLSWAAEHPEPEYPTWGEWFVEQSGFVKEWENATNPAWEASIAIGMFRMPIPADIALKLGIEPKEG